MYYDAGSAKHQFLIKDPLPTSGKAAHNLEHTRLPKRRALLKLEGGRSKNKIISVVLRYLAI
jgi:hypothetical protein